MQHNDDAFTAMLLTLPLTADKEELVRPLASAEFIQLVKRVEEAGLGTIGSLIGMDISAVMAKLDMPEQEAYRICMLLSRTMPLSYAMERFYEQNIEILTGMDEEYPVRLTERLGTDAPTAMYVSGNIELLKQPMVALLAPFAVTRPAMKSSSSRVVTPGFTSGPTSSRISAATRPASRIPAKSELS